MFAPALTVQIGFDRGRSGGLSGRRRVYRRGGGSLDRVRFGLAILMFSAVAPFSSDAAIHIGIGSFASRTASSRRILLDWLFRAIPIVFTIFSALRTDSRRSGWDTAGWGSPHLSAGARARR